MASDISSNNVLVIVAIVVMVLIGGLVASRMGVFGSDDVDRGGEGDHRGRH